MSAPSIFRPDFWNSYWAKAYMYIKLGDIDSAKRMVARTPGQHSIEFEKELMVTRFVLKQYDKIIEVGSVEPEKMSWLQDIAVPFAYWVARAHEQKGDAAAAERYYTIALTRLQDELAQRPEDYRLHSALGEVYAALGDKDDAIRHGLRGKELMPVKKDYLNAMDRIWSMAQIYALVGEPELALDEIEFLLVNYSFASTHSVGLEPAFDSLHDHPRYSDLMTRFALAND